MNNDVEQPSTPKRIPADFKSNGNFAVREECLSHCGVLVVVLNKLEGGVKRQNTLYLNYKVYISPKFTVTKADK